MLGRYQLDRAKKNLSGYALLGLGRDCGCGGACCSSHGLSGLGQNPTLTAQAAMQAAEQAYSGQNLNSKDFGSSSFQSSFESQVTAGQIDLEAYSPSCGTPTSNVNLFQTVSGLALGTTSAGVGILAATTAISTATAAIAGAATMGVGAIFAVIDLIFAHHAAAVKRDLAFGCAAIPAVNNSFALVAQAVANGSITPATAAAGLWEIYTQFMQAGGANGSASGPSGIPGGGTAINNSPYCNSNCEISVLLYAMILYWQAQYEEMAAAAAPAAPAAASNSSSSAPATAAAASSSSSSTPATAAAATPASTAAATPSSMGTLVGLGIAALIGLALAKVI